MFHIAAFPNHTTYGLNFSVISFTPRKEGKKKFSQPKNTYDESVSAYRTSLGIFLDILYYYIPHCIHARVYEVEPACFNGILMASSSEPAPSSGTEM